MADSYSTAPESILYGPPTLPTYLLGSLHGITNNYTVDFEKQQAIEIERKIKLLMEKFNPVPFAPSQNLDFSKHENMLKVLGLWDFAHKEFDTGVRVDLIAELISTYDPKFQCSYLNGTRITVNRTHLARAMKLHLKKSDVVELDLKEESMEFIVDFLLNWVFLHGAKCLLPIEVLNWVKVIKDGHPEKLDWAGLLWLMVEKELSQGVKLEDCYYASHLQCLIKSQCEDLFLEEESKNWERVINDLRKIHCKEIKKRDEEILSLEHEVSENRKKYSEKIKEMDEEILDLEHEMSKNRKIYRKETKKRDEEFLQLERELSENRELMKRYKEAIEEMQNVVKECKKLCMQDNELPENGSNKSLEISKEAICKDDSYKRLRSQCKKKFNGVDTSKMEMETVTECRQGYELPEDGNNNNNNKRLRIESKSQCKNKFIGVYKTRSGSWESSIRSTKLKKKIYLGTFPSAEAAARAYDAANLCINGSKAIFNFPLSPSIAANLPPFDTVMSIQTLKQVAAAAAKNTCFIENGESSKHGQKEGESGRRVADDY